MTGKLLLCVFMVIAANAVYANEPPEAPAKSKSAVTVVGYKDSFAQMDTLFLAPSDNQAAGLRLDYRPFASYGFNLSAASVLNQYNAQSFSTLQRTYLGVGWRRLLDDSQHFGVRVDIGAIFDDNDPQNAAGNKESSEPMSIPDNTWHPVISLGVSYEF